MPLNKKLEITLVDESAVPSPKSSKSEDWLALLKRIPTGKALVVTETDLGVSGTAAKIMVNRYVKIGLLPPTYKVSQRSKGEGSPVTVYIINSAEEREQPKEQLAEFADDVPERKKRGRPPKLRPEIVNQ